MDRPDFHRRHASERDNFLAKLPRMFERAFRLRSKEVSEDFAPEAVHQQCVLLILEGRGVLEGDNFVLT